MRHSKMNFVIAVARICTDNQRSKIFVLMLLWYCFYDQSSPYDQIVMTNRPMTAWLFILELVFKGSNSTYNLWKTTNWFFSKSINNLLNFISIFISPLGQQTKGQKIEMQKIKSYWQRIITRQLFVSWTDHKS